MSKVIKLDKGYETIVDDSDFEHLNSVGWFALESGGATYAVRHVPKKNTKTGKTLTRMHRVIMGEPLNKCIDHINGNALDNRWNNLRICSHSQNIRNQKPQIGKTSKYKGVFLDKRTNKWGVKIKVNMKKIHLGQFCNELEAAKVYDKAARKYFGEFARTNFDG